MTTIGGRLISNPKLSDTVDYSGDPAPNPNDAGTKQTSAFASPPLILETGVYTYQDQLQALPSATNCTVTCSDPRFVQVGSRQQYALTLKLGESATLIGGAANAYNIDSGVPITGFSFVSRNVMVATIDSSGVITTHSAGGVSLACRYCRAINSSFDSSPYAAEFCEASIQLTVTN